MNKSRLEAFSDGVMAIIITIMVLELKIPQGSSLKDLESILPSFFSYAQSFWFIGVYWNNHHHLLHTVKKVNGRIMVCNLLLLFFLSLVPFTTNWVSETKFAPVPVAVYAVVLVITALGWSILQITIERTSGWSEEVKKAMDRQGRKGKISTLLYASGILFAFVNPYISEGLFLLVAIMWLLPDKDIEKAFSGEKHEE
jgi:uncharacterized membrane protein